MDKETVRKVAKVARLHLEDDELEELAVELEKILEHFSAISEIKETGEENDVYYVLDVQNEYSEDKSRKIIEKESEEIRAQFTKTEGKSLSAPKSLKK